MIYRILRQPISF